ncbi:MAG: hypothetical protein ACP5MC_01295 [Candidatus Micrarchaeia archaeon]
MGELSYLYKLDDSVQFLASICTGIAFLAFACSLLLAFAAFSEASALLAIVCATVIAVLIFLAIRKKQEISKSAVAVSVLAATANTLILLLLYLFY